MTYLLKIYRQKFYKEALACSRLKDQSFVPFIGVYSTPKHPLALVFEFMEHSNLRKYLRNNKDVRRRELVRFYRRIRCSSYQRLELAVGNSARCRIHAQTKCRPREPQDRMPHPPLHSGHALTFTQTNILVDAHGRAHVAGLGVAFLLSAMPGVDIDRFFRGAAPELIDPQRFGLAGGGATKASDVYAFGVLAWEVSSILGCPMGEPLTDGVTFYLRFSLDELHFPMRVRLRGSTRC